MKKRRLPFGVYNVLLCLLATALAVLVCLCAERAEQRYYLKWDISDSRVSELSDYTLSRLEVVDEPVTLFLVYSSGVSDTLRSLQEETLAKMASICGFLQVEDIDPDTQPQRLLDLAGERTGVANGTVFVRSSQTGRTIRLEPEDFLFSRRLSDEIYTIYSGEAQLIGAIDRVCEENTVTVWYVSGHGESGEAACSQLSLQLRAMGLEVGEGVLSTLRLQPEDVLMVIDPQADLTLEESDCLKAFLDAGGKMVIACGADTPVESLTEWNALLDLYGLGWAQGWVVEDASETAFYVDRPELLSPQLKDTSVMDTLPGRLLCPRSCAVQTPSLRPGVTVKELLTTSAKAVRKASAQGDAYLQEEGDKSGEMLLAVLAESGEMCILQLASADMLRDDQSMSGGTTVLDASENLAFVAECVEQMTDREISVTLDAGVKQLPAQLITFDNQETRNTVSLLLVVVPPLTVLVAMLVVLLRRRRL